MTIELMKQALDKACEAMEAACKHIDELKAENASLHKAIQEEALRNVQRLGQEIEAEKQEPVAWRGYNWSHSPDDWVYRDFDDPILDGSGNNVGQPLYTSPPQRQPLTEREIELIDGMIEVQLQHAMQCDRIANRTMADKQKGWDMERVELLQKMKAAHGIKGEA